MITVKKHCLSNNSPPIYKIHNYYTRKLDEFCQALASCGHYSLIVNHIFDIFLNPENHDLSKIKLMLENIPVTDKVSVKDLCVDFYNSVKHNKEKGLMDDPFLLEESELLEPEHRNMGKSSMSRRTALSLSFNNLRTKKARTFLVAIAGSIGIIGIALILSLSNGVNDYIKNIEEQTLSMYPLQIDSTSFSMSNLMGLVENVEDAKAKQAEVTEMKTMTSMFTTIQKNDLKSLKEYFDSDESHMDDYVNSIEYNYGISPIIFKVNEDSVRQVNPDQSMSAMGLSYSGSNSMFTGFQSLYDIFHSLPESDHLYSVQYDVKAGHWPENYNEAVVVLTEDARVTDMTLYTLGLKDAAELDAAMKDFSEGKETSPMTRTS